MFYIEDKIYLNLKLKTISIVSMWFIHYFVGFIIKKVKPYQNDLTRKI